MRGPSARNIACTAVCAAFLAGVTVPAALAADSAQERGQAVSAAPLPGAGALKTRVKNIGSVDTVHNPVTALLNAVLKADNGRLSATEKTRLFYAAEQAVTDQKAIAGTQAKDAVNDAVNDALTALQKALNTLQQVVASGNAGQVVTAVNDVVTALVNYVTAVLGSAGPPTPTPTPIPSVPVPTPSVPGV